MLAREIAGPNANAETHALARQIAEAQIDLRRVRCARHKLLSDALANPYYERRQDTRQKAAVLNRLLRTNAPDVPMENLVAFLTSTPQGPHKFAKSSRKRLNNCWRWIAMNGERYTGESLLFDPSIRYADSC